MIDTNISILSTRHLSENSIEEAAWAGIHIDVTPFIQVEIREDEALLESLAALAQSPILAVCTSRYAIQALQELIPEPPQSWKIACTNGKTAAEAIEWLGEDALVATGPNAATLAAQLTGLQSSAPVVFFCGDSGWTICRRLYAKTISLLKSGSYTRPPPHRWRSMYGTTRASCFSVQARYIAFSR